MKADRDRYHSDAQQRVLRTMLALAGHEFSGMLPSELAKAANSTPSNVTRDLANLQAAGIAEQIPETGRWRLGPKVIQLALSFSTAIERARTQLDGITQRYTRTY